MWSGVGIGSRRYVNMILVRFSFVKKLMFGGCSDFARLSLLRNDNKLIHYKLNHSNYQNTHII